MKRDYSSRYNYLSMAVVFIFLSNSLIAQSKLQLISPNGGETFKVGTRQSISWISTNVNTIDISYSIDNGKNWIPIFNNISAEVGVVGWKIPNLINKQIIIKIKNTEDLTLDVSDSYFTVNNNFSARGALSKLSSTNQTTIIMPLGNSITYDNRVNDSRAVGDKIGYRLPLYNLLTNSGYDFAFTGSEHAGGNFLPAGYDANAGFPGIKDDQLAYLLKTGRLLMPQYGIDEQLTTGPYLDTYFADIILLHIGTNGNDATSGTSPDDVEQILDEVKRYEDSTGTEITVILARIIDRVPNQSYVNIFNNNVETMALDRVYNPANDAYPDKIIIVDMEDGANFNYTISPDPNGTPGDMNDYLHPNDKGFAKMADVWFQILTDILPGEPIITKQPNNQSIVAGESATFSITATGNPPLSYQWKKNGIDIPGENSPTLNLYNVPASDDSSTLYCVVSNLSSSVTSDPAILYVTDENERVKHGVELLYTFTEGTGTIVFDKSKRNPLINLSVGDTLNSNWVPYGLFLYERNLLMSNLQPTRIFDAITNSNEITLETWILPLNRTQDGPARIMTYSSNGGNRNFTLGQRGNEFIVRLRTTETDLNGLPELSTASETVDTLLTHLLFTRDSLGISKLYVNGIFQKIDTLGGNFSNWDSLYSFGLGDEFESADTDRFWLGKYYLACVYSRALGENEVLHNYKVGFEGKNKLLAVPTNLSGIVDNDTNVVLNWEDNETKEQGYIIERRANNIDSVYYTIDSVGANITQYTDHTTKYTTSYYYRVKAFNNLYESDYSDTVRVDNIVTDVSDETIPTSFMLYQNYPNPFNPSTNIKFSLEKRSLVSLQIFNLLGENVTTLLKNKELTPGIYKIKFSADNLPTGIYFYKLTANTIDKNITNYKIKKLLLLK